MGAATPPLAVDARHLVKRYRSKTAVDGIDLQLRAGEVFSLLGTNGASKTTTVETLAGLRRPTQASARVLGLNPFSDLMRFLILGTLLDGPLPLYDMRKQSAAGITLFYTASFGSIQRALGRLPAADRRACVRRGAAREDRGGCRSARLVGSGTRCYRVLGRRPAGLPLPAGDPGPRHLRACARNAVARREETA